MRPIFTDIRGHRSSRFLGPALFLTPGRTDPHHCDPRGQIEYDQVMASIQAEWATLKVWQLQHHFWSFSHVLLSAMAPHTRRVKCPAYCPCLLDADWRLQPDVTDGILDSRVKGLSTDDARKNFMDVIAEWPYYQHQIFDVKVGGTRAPAWPGYGRHLANALHVCATRALDRDPPCLCCC